MSAVLTMMGIFGYAVKGKQYSKHTAKHYVHINFSELTRKIKQVSPCSSFFGQGGTMNLSHDPAQAGNDSQFNYK